MKDEHAYGKKWPERVVQRSFIKGHSFPIGLYMKVRRMGMTEILRRIWLFSANRIKNSESFSKQPTQLGT